MSNPIDINASTPLMTTAKAEQVAHLKPTTPHSATEASTLHHAAPARNSAVPAKAKLSDLTLSEPRVVQDIQTDEDVFSSSSSLFSFSSLLAEIMLSSANSSEAMGIAMGSTVNLQSKFTTVGANIAYEADKQTALGSALSASFELTGNGINLGAKSAGFVMRGISSWAKDDQKCTGVQNNPNASGNDVKLDSQTNPPAVPSTGDEAKGGAGGATSAYPTEESSTGFFTGIKDGLKKAAGGTGWENFEKVMLPEDSEHDIIGHKLKPIEDLGKTFSNAQEELASANQQIAGFSQLSSHLSQQVFSQTATTVKDIEDLNASMRGFSQQIKALQAHTAGSIRI